MSHKKKLREFTCHILKENNSPPSIHKPPEQEYKKLYQFLLLRAEIIHNVGHACLCL